MCVCVYVCVQVHEYVPSLCMCTCVCMRRSKVDAPCVPQGLSINLEITGSITESGQQAGGFSSLCLLLIAGLTGVCSVFYTRTGDLNLHLYACTPSTWPTELPPQHWHLRFFNISRRLCCHIQSWITTILKIAVEWGRVIVSQQESVAHMRPSV